MATEGGRLGSRNQFLDLLRAFALLLATAVLAGRLFLIVKRYSVNILYHDQWIFDDATIFQDHSLLEIFRWQHGPHRQGLGGVLSKLIEPSLHWNSRYEAFGVWGIICLACLAAIWLKVRLFGKPIYADIVIPLFFFTPVQYESLIGGASPSHGPLPLLLVTLYCLAWTIKAERWKYVWVLVLNLFLIYTGFGLFMGVLTPFVAGMDFYRRRSRAALVACVVSIATTASFFVGYRTDTAAGCSVGVGNPVHYFLFVGFMLANFIQIHVSRTLVLAIMIGSLLTLLFVLTSGHFLIRTLRDKTPSVPRLIICILLLYSLLFSFSTAYGRICLGLAAAQGSRYMTYLVLLFFALYLAALSAQMRIEKNVFVGLVVGLGLLSSGFIERVNLESMQEIAHERQAWATCYLRTNDIDSCDRETDSYICWKPEPPDLQRKLEYFKQHRLNLYSK